MILLVALLAGAQPADWHFDARVDPVVAAVLGISAGVDAAPADSRWRYSLAAFHVDVPDLIVPLIARGVPDVKVTEDALQLAALYDVEDEHRGLFLGPELYVYALTYKARGHQALAREAYAHLTAGYTWFPFTGDVVDRFFLQPWATVGVPIFHSGGADLAGGHVDDRVLNWHATVELGVRFL